MPNGGPAAPVLRRLQAFAPPASDLRAFEGDYRSAELDTTFTVVTNNSDVLVKAQGRATVVILAVAHDEFVGDSVGELRFVRNAAAGIVEFTVNRDNARGVLF
jgi:hypothetical protein